MIAQRRGVGITGFTHQRRMTCVSHTYHHDISVVTGYGIKPALCCKKVISKDATDYSFIKSVLSLLQCSSASICWFLHGCEVACA